MNNNNNNNISSISASVADSTDMRVSDQNKVPTQTQTRTRTRTQDLLCLSSSDALIPDLDSGSDSAVFKDSNLLDASLVSKPFGERGSDGLRCDSDLWDFVNVPRTDPSFQSGSCKFIKDEKVPARIMDLPCPNFDPEIPVLDSCCDMDRRQQVGLREVESSSFSPAPGPRSGLDPNPVDQLNQGRTESSCVLSGKPVHSFDPNLSSGPQLPLYRTEVTRWHMNTSPAETQFWCQNQTTGTEDLFKHGGYEGIQNQVLTQRNPSPFTFTGMPPQRMCVICGDEASGCHYGVLTCGSCKVFFKRAVEGHHSYLCAGRNDCIVDKIRRKNCPACRLRKCYQAGMMLGGRKLKRFGTLKALGLAPSMMFQSHLAMSGDAQALTSVPCVPGVREVHLSQQILNVLENIEPETMYSGYDNSQPEVPHLLLNSLNRLCEKQLLWIVKWSKSLPGFRNLHITDQMTLIQYSWMNLMVFSLGWRSYQNVTSEYLYFAPDLVLSQDQMRRSPIYDLCLAIQFIPQEFFNLQVTREEFLCMKAIILLNTVPLEGLKSQAAFEEMRQSYIRELTRAIHMREKGLVSSSQRFYHLTKLMDAMHDIVKKVNLFCLTTFIQADAMKVEFPEMMTEVIASQLPKILAGMVRPLLFHTK